MRADLSVRATGISTGDPDVSRLLSKFITRNDKQTSRSAQSNASTGDPKNQECSKEMKCLNTKLGQTSRSADGDATTLSGRPLGPHAAMPKHSAQYKRSASV